MKDVEQRIGEFFKRTQGSTTDTSILRLDPNGPFTYLFSQDSCGPTLLADRLRGPGIKRSLAATLLSSGARYPSLLHLLPDVSRTQVPTDGKGAFVLAIASKRQITLLSPERGTVTTIGWPEKSRVTDEIKTRSELPAAVNVPAFIDVDESFPYFVTEFIQGRTVESPVREWRYVLDALDQLQSWYSETRVGWVKTNLATTDLREKLNKNTQDPLIKGGLDLLRELELPDQLSRSQTHGDIHAENLRIANGTTYILDWEHAQVEYSIRDFFMPFHQWTGSTGDRDIVSKIIFEEGIGRRITAEYADRVGPEVWNGSKWHGGLFLFAILNEISKKGQTESQARTMLKEII